MHCTAGAGTVRDGAPVQTDALAKPATPAAASPATTSPDKPREERAGESAPNKHTPGTRIEKSRTGTRQLTRAQQAYVDKLIANYTKCTAASKAFAQRHRRHLAVLALYRSSIRYGMNDLPDRDETIEGSKTGSGRARVLDTEGFGPILSSSPDCNRAVRADRGGYRNGPQSPLPARLRSSFAN